MKDFNCKDDALRYAENHLGKYESEIAHVNGKKTLICATDLPLEVRFRNSIEMMVRDFFTEMDYEDDDVVYSVGAELSEQLMNMITHHTPLDIVCAYQSY